MNKHQAWQHYSQRRPSSSTPEDDFDAGWNMEKEQGHCKDCRYWTRHTNRWGKEWTECAVDSADHDTIIGEAEAALYVNTHDDFGSTAGLMTGPMFGCVQFKAHIKEDELK